MLATERGVSVLEENQRLQRSMGADTEILVAKTWPGVFPWMNFDGIAAASFGPRNEGWFDPYSLMTLLRKAALAQEVTLVPRAVTAVARDRAITASRWTRARPSPWGRWSMRGASAGALGCHGRH